MSTSTARQLAMARTFSSFAGAMPWGMGQYHLARPLVARQAWPAGFSALQTMKSGARLRLDLSDRTQLIAFLLRKYSPEIESYIDARVPPRGTLLDVGGNVGMVTFGVAARRPDIDVHAFEPNPVNIAAWRRNHALNPRVRARLVESAVSDHDGELRFDVPGDSGSGMIAAAGSQTVRVVSLDAYCASVGLERVDVLKIDVQGHEPAVLAGARRMLSEGRIDTVVCEICEPLLALDGRDRTAIVGPLVEHGFALKPLPDTRVTRRLPIHRAGADEDVVFERRG